MMSNKRQAGFTVLEMTIATAVFSTILLVITAGIISFTRSYLNGVHRSQTQETARLVMEEVSQTVQFSSAYRCSVPTCTPPADMIPYAYCFGNVKYSFQTNIMVKDVSHALVRSPYAGGACIPTLSVSSDDTELLGENMRLHQFAITDNGDNSFGVSIRIIYGATDLITGDRCTGEAGGEYCAAAGLNTTVQRRL